MKPERVVAELVWPRVTDGRGVARPLCRVRAAPEGACRKWIRRSQWTGAAILVGGGLIVLSAAEMVTEVIWGGETTVMSRVSFMAVWAALAVPAYFGRGYTKRAALAGLRRSSACASCGYSLRGLTTDTDGCIVCPECGAAWRWIA